MVPHPLPWVIDTEGEDGRGEIGIDASVFLDWGEITASGGPLGLMGL